MNNNCLIFEILRASLGAATLLQHTYKMSSVACHLQPQQNMTTEVVSENEALTTNNIDTNSLTTTMSHFEDVIIYAVGCPIAVNVTKYLRNTWTKKQEIIFIGAC